MRPGFGLRVGQRTEDEGQRMVGRRTEDRGLRTEDGGQKTDDRRLRVILSPESLVLCPAKGIPRPAK